MDADHPGQGKGQEEKEEVGGFGQRIGRAGDR
jgi:hypothetical protein